MEQEDRAVLRSLLVDQRLVAVGLVVQGEPLVGLLPFALSQDGSALIVQASRLARHSKGLASGAPFSGVIHRPDAPGADALQTPRVLLDGVVETLEADEADREVAARAYVKRFPSAEMTLALPDFSFYRLVMRAGRLVVGFGRALNLESSHFRDLAADGGPYNS